MGRIITLNACDLFTVNLALGTAGDVVMSTATLLELDDHSDVAGALRALQNHIVDAGLMLTDIPATVDTLPRSRDLDAQQQFRLMLAIETSCSALNAAADFLSELGDTETQELLLGHLQPIMAAAKLLRSKTCAFKVRAAKPAANQMASDQPAQSGPGQAPAAIAGEPVPTSEATNSTFDQTALLAGLEGALERPTAAVV